MMRRTDMGPLQLQTDHVKKFCRLRARVVQFGNAPVAVALEAMRVRVAIEIGAGNAFVLIDPRQPCSRGSRNRCHCGATQQKSVSVVRRDRKSTRLNSS